MVITMDSIKQPLITNNNEYKDVLPSVSPSKLTFRFKLAYGVGHVLNDVCSAVWFTYLILFMQHVIKFDSRQAGFIVLVGQVADAVANPFVGYVSDAHDPHRIFSYGKRKVWHLVGTICVIFTFPFIFLPCFGARGDHVESVLFYYSMFTIVFQFGWAAVQISHLSLIPEITPDENERTELAAMRYRFTVVANIFVYVVAWPIIGSSSELDESQLSPKDASKFLQIVLYSLSFGLFCSVIFHYFVKEKPSVPVCTKKDEGDNPTSVFKMILNREYLKTAIVYMCTMLFVNLTQIYIPIYLHETLEMTRSSLALIPLVLYLGSFAASSVVERLNKALGRKGSYAVGALIGLFGCVWVQVRSKCPSFIVWEIAAVAAIIGVASAIILVTNLGITADLIGNKTRNSAFIYSIMTVTDKLANGIIVYILQYLLHIHGNKAYYEYVLVYACGGAVVVGTCSVIFIKKGSKVSERKQEEYIELP